MHTQLLFLHALTPLHAGTGQGVGVVDLPIAREKATNLPFLPGSSLKGALRPLVDIKGANGSVDETKKNLRDAVFGKEGDEGTGAAQFADARLLLLPVRSLRGTFAYATSPYVLQRFADDLRLAGQTPPSGVEVEPGHCATMQGSPLLLDDKVFLEDLDVPHDDAADVSRWANLVANSVFLNDATARKRLSERFCLLDEDIFNFLCATATEVTARIKLKENVKSVEKGGLWYEESLPAESVLVSLLTATPLKIHKNGDRALSAPEVLQAALPETKTVAQFGGKASVGRGLCRISRLANRGGAIMQTRSQKYALAAWDKVQKRKTEGNNAFNKDEYGGMAHKLPVLIQTCGLVQALAFVEARGKESHKMLLSDLAETLETNHSDLLRNSREADLLRYMRLSQQTIEALLWFKRFAQSELDVQDAGAADTDEATPNETAGES